jgi:hypothetical protein
MLAEDDDDCSYVPLPRDRRAYDFNEFMPFLQEDRDHL